MNLTEKRQPLASLFFMVSDCCQSFNTLKEVSELHKRIINGENELRKSIPFSPEVFITLVGISRDYFCIRLASLFDPVAHTRKDTYSLKRFYTGKEIQDLESHPVTKDCIKARNKNIAHFDEDYTKWPNIDEIAKF